MKPDGQRLYHRAVNGVKIIRQLKAVSRRKDHIVLHAADIGIGREEAHVLAQVIPPYAAILTVAARSAGLHAHAVADLHVGHVRAERDYIPRKLMAEHERIAYHALSGAPLKEVVHIRAAHAAVPDFYKDLIRFGFGHRAHRHFNFPFSDKRRHSVYQAKPLLFFGIYPLYCRAVFVYFPRPGIAVRCPSASKK